MTSYVTYSIDGRVATVTLNRPEKRNALNGELVEGLAGALRDAADDDRVRVVILTGAGTVFSAGADLEALRRMQSGTTLENGRDSRRLADLFLQLYLHPKAVIARVNGHAVAGGCGLAAACDFAIAADDAKFGFTEVRIGFVPAIVSVFVLRKMGEAAARDLLLRGRLISAAEAVRIGLITKAVAPAHVGAEVDDLARELATQTSGSAIMLTKRVLAESRTMGLKEAMDQAVSVNALARETPDFKAGIEAFLSKTDPPWKSG